MEGYGSVSFKHWVHLQKCLKYEKLRLSHGIPNTDEQEKQSLLSRLRSLHIDYYQFQLSIRELLSKSTLRKVLDPEPRQTLGDSFTYVERFVLALRNSPAAFSLLVESITPTTPHLDLLVESFAFSFFEDLMNPENSEYELLKVIHELAKLEFSRRTHITTMFEENSSSVLSKMLVFYTKRRSQMKYLKLLFKKPLIKIASESTEDWVLDLRELHENINKQLEKPESGNPDAIKKKKKKSLFGMKIFQHERAETPPPPEQPDIDPSEYLNDPQVRSKLSEVTTNITLHCKSFLDSIYSNVKAMPYGVRWVCKTLSDLSRETVECSDETRNVMLGTFLFMKWWLPAIIRADENGLLQDTNVAGIKKNLSFIGNVLKRVFRCEMFDLPQYEGINNFIASQM